MAVLYRLYNKVILRNTYLSHELHYIHYKDIIIYVFYHNYADWLLALWVLDEDFLGSISGCTDIKKRSFLNWFWSGALGRASGTMAILIFKIQEIA